MAAIASTPGALRLAAVSIVARLPMAMLSIALLVHVHHLTGSFATAGIVAGAFAVSLGVGGPLLGRQVDRRGQTTVLLAAGAATVLAAVTAIVVGTTGDTLTLFVAIGWWIVALVGGLVLGLFLEVGATGVHRLLDRDRQGTAASRNH